MLARFEAERQALALMDHPDIASVLDAGATEDGRPYFVMEYVEGQPLTAHCDRHRLGSRRGLELFLQVCRGGPARAPEGDHPPGHQALERPGGGARREAPAKVIDFGIAKATDHGRPERTLSTELGRGRRDAGVHEPRAGGPPARTSTPGPTSTRSASSSTRSWSGSCRSTRGRDAGLGELLRAIVEEDPPRPSLRLAQPDVDRHEAARRRSTSPAAHARELRRDLDWIALKAIDRDRARRYATAGDLAADVRRRFRNEPVSASPPAPSYRLRKFARRHRGALAAAGIAAAALLAGLAASVALYLEASGARRALSTQVEAVRRTVGERDAALAGKERALLRSEGLRLSAQAAELLEADPIAAVHLAIEGARRHDDARTRNTLLATLQRAVPCRVLESHRGEVYGIELSSDGDRALTWSRDRTARVWRTDTGDLLLILAHRQPVATAAWSPDGRRIATGAGRQAVIWDSEDGAALSLLSGHTGAVSAVAFSPDGRRLVSGSRDATARLWDVGSGKPMAVLAGHTDRVYRPLFSPDGTRVITASRDGTARIWDAATGEPLLVLSGHRAQVDTAVFSSDGDLALTSSHDLTARLWDARTGGLRAVLQGHGAQLLDARFSPDGRRIATASNDRTARIWDTAGRELLVLSGHAALVRSARFARDGTRVITFSDDRSLRIWSAGSGALLRKIGGHGGPILDAAVAPNGRRMVSASADGTARIWDLAAPEVPARVSCSASRVVSVSFSAAGDRLLTAHCDGALALWDPRTGERVQDWSASSSIAGAAFDPEGRVLVRYAGGTVAARDPHPAQPP